MSTRDAARPAKLVQHFVLFLQSSSCNALFPAISVIPSVIYVSLCILSNLFQVKRNKNIGKVAFGLLRLVVLPFADD